MKKKYEMREAFFADSANYGKDNIIKRMVTSIKFCMQRRKAKALCKKRQAEIDKNEEWDKLDESLTAHTVYVNNMEKQQRKDYERGCKIIRRLGVE